jgi:DNA-3-methyladenine glycosylase II
MNIPAALAHLRSETNIAQLIDRIELPEHQPSGAVYFDLLESIVSQQLSVKAATTIFNRFLDLFEDRYPHPEQVTNLEIDVLRGVGLSNQKAQYLQNVAAFALEHQWQHRDWHAMSDDDIIAHLTQIKGVGKWTVQMVLMFTLNRPDIFPVDDLGIQQGVARMFGLDEKSKDLKKQMEALSAPWKPYRTLACRYIWRSR